MPIHGRGSSDPERANSSWVDQGVDQGVDKGIDDGVSTMGLAITAF